MAVCLNGHDSAGEELCDVCGARIVRKTSGGKHASSSPPADGEACPRCGKVSAGPFCEACGFRFRSRRPFDPIPSAEPTFAPSSSGPPESLFPPVPRPEPLASPWVRADAPTAGQGPGPAGTGTPSGPSSPGTAPSPEWRTAAPRPASAPPGRPEPQGTSALLESLFAPSPDRAGPADRIAPPDRTSPADRPAPLTGRGVPADWTVAAPADRSAPAERSAPPGRHAPAERPASTDWTGPTERPEPAGWSAPADWTAPPRGDRPAYEDRAAPADWSAPAQADRPGSTDWPASDDEWTVPPRRGRRARADLPTPADHAAPAQADRAAPADWGAPPQADRAVPADWTTAAPAPQRSASGSPGWSAPEDFTPPATPIPSASPGWSGWSDSPDSSVPEVGWSIVVGPDRAYYERMKAIRGLNGATVMFPAERAERRFSLAGKQMRIGRHSAARDLEPEIDLAGPHADPGISRLHAVLIATSEGGWAVLDPGSANGTLLNGREVAVGELVALRDGDRINLGAWTAITVRQAGGR